MARRESAVWEGAGVFESIACHEWARSSCLTAPSLSVVAHVVLRLSAEERQQRRGLSISLSRGRRESFSGTTRSGMSRKHEKQIQSGGTWSLFGVRD